VDIAEPVVVLERSDLEFEDIVERAPEQRAGGGDFFSEAAYPHVDAVEAGRTDVVRLVCPRAGAVHEVGGIGGWNVADVRLDNLANCSLNQPMRVARVVDQEAAFLQFVDRCGLMPGVGVKVEHRDAQSDAVAIRAHGRGVVTLGTAAAAKILVEKA